MKSLVGGKSVKGILPEIEMYELCTLLHKTPSEIKSESYEDIAGLLLVHNAKNKYESEAQKKGDKKQARKNVADKYR